MYVTDQTEEGFHTKGYIFKKEEMYRIIVGSSNMTLSALTVNREWNIRIVFTEHGEYAQSVLTEFEDLWNSSQAVEFEQFIDSYTENYIRNKIIRKQKELVRQGQERRMQFSLWP